MTPNGLVPLAEFDTKDGVYDCAWSEVCIYDYLASRLTNPSFVNAMGLSLVCGPEIALVVV